ncbi:aminotransferase class I/II-fold pyridoxal phosphate-dependent enzyme [Patescibacteria group bacterium]
MFRPISISLSPNTESDDIWLAFKMIFQPWKWKKGSGISDFEKEFKTYFHFENATSFNSGRSALFAILKSLNFTKGEEVLLQAFTCNALVNPILWTGLKPVYIDCDKNTFNISPEDLEKKITQKSKAVIIQHTFGNPADIDKILEICAKHDLFLIEDCAHSLGALYHRKPVGSFGRAAFFSFSRDKVLSCVYGGIAVAFDKELALKIKEFQKEAGFPSYFWIFQQLLHPILMNWKILPTYSFFGKYLLVLLQWLHILSKAVHWKEKRGKKPGYFPKLLPNALSLLAALQFKKLERFNNHRGKIADFYLQKLQGSSFTLPNLSPDKKHIFLRFPIRHKKAHEIIKKSWKKNMLIGDWYDSVIAPSDTRLKAMGYEKGSCKNAEDLTQETFNLPTHINISVKEAQKIVNFLRDYGN